jgi:putative flippase GtrA
MANDIADVPGHSRGLPRQLTRFAAIGVASTIGYLLLYVLLRGALGAFAANALALLITAMANTAANRRMTFGVTGPRGRYRQYAAGLAVFGLGIALTSCALGALAAVGTNPPRIVELGVLVAANLTATALRFLVFRAWVFPRHELQPT